MTKKEYLEKSFKINLEIETKKEVLDEFRSNLDGLKSMRTREKLQGGIIENDFGITNKLNKIIEMEKELNELYGFQMKLSENIDRMENINEKAVLRLRYILNKTWEQVAEKMGYSLMNTHRIHKKAINNLKLI